MPSYTQYKRQMAVMDADDANIETWITVKGNHIPIMKGQSKEEAVQSFLEKKGKSSGGAKKEPAHSSGSYIKLKGASQSGGVPDKVAERHIITVKEKPAKKEPAQKSGKSSGEKFVDKTGTGFVKINRHSNKATPNKVTYKELYEGIKSGKTIPEMTGIKSDSDDEMDILLDLQDAMGFSNEEFNKLYDKHKSNFSSGKNPGFRELKGTKHQGGTIGLSKEEHNRIEEYNKWARKETRRVKSGEAAREANARPILKADENADVSDIVKQYKADMKALGENASAAKQNKVEVNAIKEFMRRKVGAGHPYEDYYNYWLRGMSKNDSDAFNSIYGESENREKAFEALSNEKDKPANKGWQNARSSHPETIGKVVRRVVKKMGEQRAESKKPTTGSSSGWPESPKFEKLTEKYMPKSGAADNELGEALRSINQAVYRYYNDGDMYNKGYGKETVNAAIKHLTQLSKNKATPRHIARGIDNGLYELKTYGVKDKGRYETALKILLQTFEFADEKDIDALSKMKRNND
jgi:hypothetical protein